MNLYVIVAIALAAFASGGATSWKVQSWRHDAQEKQRMEQEAKEQGIRAQRIDTAASGHEADKKEIQAERVTITKTVEKIVEKPVYRDMCLDDDGLRALGAAIAPDPAASQPQGAVPRPSSSR